MGVKRKVLIEAIKKRHTVYEFKRQMDNDKQKCVQWVVSLHYVGQCILWKKFVLSFNIYKQRASENTQKNVKKATFFVW